MFIQVLVEDKIRAGQAIQDALRKDKFRISAAFWCRMPESGYWRLVIASKLIGRIGHAEGYRRLGLITERLGLRSEFSGSISLVSPTEPVFLRLREIAQYGYGPISDAPPVVYQEAYIYQL